MRRMAVACVAALTLAGCGGAEEPADAVRDYMEEANAVQARYAPALGDANAVYAQQASGTLASREQLPRLEAATDALGAARGQLTRLDPPAPARELHRRLLDVFDRNIELSEETVALARYGDAAPRVLRAVAPAARRLQGSLDADADAGEQAAALEAYRAALGRVVDRLRDLDAPVVLRPAHQAQIRQLERTRSLAGGLTAAVRDGDAPRLARLLLRFRALNVRPSPVQSRATAVRGVRAYRERVRRLGRAQAQLNREQNRVKREVAA